MMPSNSPRAPGTSILAILGALLLPTSLSWAQTTPAEHLDPIAAPQSATRDDTVHTRLRFIDEYAGVRQLWDQTEKRQTLMVARMRELLDPRDAKRQVDQNRSLVARLLERVADNGELTVLGGKVIQKAERHLKRLESGSHGNINADERKRLIANWRLELEQTTKVVETMRAARVGLVEQLHFFQEREDFIAEVSLLQRADEMRRIVIAWTRELDVAVQRMQEFRKNFPTTPAT